MALEVYLVFDGKAREAAEFYADAFGTEKPQIMTFGEAPPDPNFQLPPEAKDRVMHANLKVSCSNLMFSDTFPGMPYTVGNNINIALVSKDLDEVQRAFNRLKEGGKVTMELQETFWSKCYGALTDKFGIEWQLSFASGNASN